MRIYINTAEGLKQIKEGVSEVFRLYEGMLPESLEASIFLKPNLNANMNALTGNTTDLRLIAVIIE